MTKNHKQNVNLKYKNSLTEKMKNFQLNEINVYKTKFKFI